MHEDLIALYRISEFRAGNIIERCRKCRRPDIGFARELQPEIILEKRFGLRRNEAHLGWHVSGTLGTRLQLEEFLTHLAKEDNDLTPHCTGFGEAKAQHINARAPRHVSKTVAAPSQSIGEPSAIKMNFQPSLMCKRRVAGDRLNAVSRAAFGQRRK